MFSYQQKSTKIVYLLIHLADISLAVLPVFARSYAKICSWGQKKINL